MLKICIIYDQFCMPQTPSSYLAEDCHEKDHLKFKPDRSRIFGEKSAKMHESDMIPSYACQRHHILYLDAHYNDIHLTLTLAGLIRYFSKKCEKCELCLLILINPPYEKC